MDAAKLGENVPEATAFLKLLAQYSRSTAPGNMMKQHYIDAKDSTTTPQWLTGEQPLNKRRCCLLSIDMKLGGFSLCGGYSGCWEALERWTKYVFLVEPSPFRAFGRDVRGLFQVE